MWGSFTRVRTITVAGAVTVGLLASGAGVADASTGQVSVSESVSPTTIASVAIPETQTVVSSTPQGLAGLTLPGEVSAERADPDNVPAGLFEGRGDPVLNTKLDNAVISSYAKDNGAQTLIKIESAAASTEYQFPLSIPAGYTAAVEADGSVLVRDTAGIIIGGYKTPWAYDATGAKVPTKFTLDGNTLTQTVDFDENTVFPVVADPNDFWGWTVCVAAVGAAITPWGAGAGLAVRLIARFGSVLRGIEIVWRAWNVAGDFNKKWNSAMVASGGLFGEILGINAVRDACFS